MGVNNDTDIWVARIVAGALACAFLASLIGEIVLAALGKPIPNQLDLVIAGAGGILLGIPITAKGQVASNPQPADHPRPT